METNQFKIDISANDYRLREKKIQESISVGNQPWAQKSFVILWHFYAFLCLLEPNLALENFLIQSCVSSAYSVGCCYYPGAHVLFPNVIHLLSENWFFPTFSKYILRICLGKFLSLPSTLTCSWPTVFQYCSWHFCPPFGTCPFWRVDTYFAFGFCDRPLQSALTAWLLGGPSCQVLLVSVAFGSMYT